MAARTALAYSKGCDNAAARWHARTVTSKVGDSRKANRGDSQDSSSESKKDRAVLEELLRERNQYPERAEQIDREVVRRFSKNLAVFVLDMSGFSSTTERRGIVHFLARIHQMQEAVGPAVIGNRGQLVRYEADNAFAVFATVADAVNAAQDVDRSLDAMNAVLPPALHLSVSIGIGFGETLIIDGVDLFGDEMNRACKLGEDIGGAGEILLTEAARAQLLEPVDVESRNVVIGTFELPYFALKKASERGVK